jgi:hypothetical protein
VNALPAANQGLASLNMPTAGYRNYEHGTVYDMSNEGYYWSSTTDEDSDAYLIKSYNGKIQHYDN